MIAAVRHERRARGREQRPDFAQAHAFQPLADRQVEPQGGERQRSELELLLGARTERCGARIEQRGPTVVFEHAGERREELALVLAQAVVVFDGE